MKHTLIALLGLNSEASDKDICIEVQKLVIDLRGKEARSIQGFLRMMKDKGFLRQNDNDQTFTMRITHEHLDKILQKAEGE